MGGKLIAAAEVAFFWKPPPPPPSAVLYSCGIDEYGVIRGEATPIFSLS